MENLSKYIYLKTIAIVLFSFNLLFVKAQTIPLNLENKIDSLFVNYSNSQTPGAVVGIMLNDSIIMTKSYGIANLEQNTPNTYKTKFHIASITKQFTAYAISKLEAEGKLSYSDDIRTYLPELNNFGVPITIDQLLHHTSGIRSTNSLRLMQDQFYGRELTQQEALEVIYAQKELNFIPGSMFGYSNSGYVLLATIVEKITKMTFAEWLEINVFKPLDMDETMLNDNYKKIIPNRAEPYQKSNAGGFERTWGMLWNDYGATGIYSTVPDLMKWQKFVHSQKQLLRQILLTDGTTIPYAMGISVIKNDNNEIREASMDGEGFGYTSTLAHYPKTNLDVVVLGNIKDIALYEKAKQIERLFNTKQDNNNAPFKLEVSTLLKYVGSYRMDAVIAEFIAKDGILYALNPNGEDALLPINETTFNLPNTPIQFEFDSEGKNMTFKMPGNEILCPRIEDKNKLLVEKLDEFTGQYYSSELNIYIKLKIEENGLILYSPKEKKIEMLFNGNDSLKSKDWSYHLIQYTRDKNNQITGLRVSNADGRVQSLLFEKI